MLYHTQVLPSARQRTGSFFSSSQLHFSSPFTFFFTFSFFFSFSSIPISLSLSSLLSLIGWERYTSTSKTKTASLFCRRGGWTDRVRQTDREKDGIRWWERKRWDGKSRSRRTMMWGEEVGVSEKVPCVSVFSGWKHHKLVLQKRFNFWRSYRSTAPTQVCTNCFKRLGDRSATTTAAGFKGSVHPDPSKKYFPTYPHRCILHLDSPAHTGLSEYALYSHMKVKK